MNTIDIKIQQEDVYDEVAKATDYTGSKLVNGDDSARDRILAADDDLHTLDRFWDEAVVAVNEHLKSMLVTGKSDNGIYTACLEVSLSFDKELAPSVESTVRSFFIAAIIGDWFKFANKDEANDYFAQAAELLVAADRLLYSRKKPSRPTD